MHQYGYIRVGCAVPDLKVADCPYNTQQIISMMKKASSDHVEILVFPELAISGYTCGDLFLQDKLLKESEKGLLEIMTASHAFDMLIIVGVAIKSKQQLFNCAAVISKGQILGVVPKTYLPNYNEFYEKRWFSSDITRRDETVQLCGHQVPFGTDLLFQHEELKDLIVAAEICEDLWVPVPPSSYAALNGATLIVNPSASNELVGKSHYRKNLISSQSARLVAAYAYCSSGFGESTTDVVYGGHCLITENGSLLKESNRFLMEGHLIYSDVDVNRLTLERHKTTAYNEHVAAVGPVKSFRTLPFATVSRISTLTRTIPRHPFIPANRAERNERMEEIFAIQTMGLAKRLTHVGCEKVILGISGGLDSTLALLVCVKTMDQLGLDRKNVIGITMPGFGTTDRTYNNALTLMKNLGISMVEIPIREASIQHFKDIDHDINVHDITYENTQARERTQILMDYANKMNGLVIGTGDLSELALGWATYNGDHMSMYAVNTSIPKTLVRYIVDWVAENELGASSRNVLKDVLDTPVSPELLPPDQDGNIKQKTEDTVGPYELHDFFIYYVIKLGFTPKKIFMLACLAYEGAYTKETIYKWLRKFYWRFFSQQFKRSCLPDGPKVGSICLSPRGDWRMPSDASVSMFMSELDEIEKELG